MGSSIESISGSNINLAPKKTSAKLAQFKASMLKTLERYQKCNYGAPEPIMPSKEIQKMKCDSIGITFPQGYQSLSRHFLGEDLGPLNSKQLEQLERQLESSVRQIRSTRIQQMLDQLSDLQRKVCMRS
ncbi:hypothetical protein QJS10_CPB22g00608 [Acorus calamus]|uniref:K-box domain-containing protein n=1 Tax=Acorus calamus TaxID=4465 RepID=A0AAV9C0V6_ACOCL|nr:hypothetical protein QJS10_CPB22g00608 [Acorus calamus]